MIDPHTERDGTNQGGSRSYAVPYERVWRVAIEVARSSPRWTVGLVDPSRGRIEAEARTLVWKFVDRLTISIRLDELGSTRLDVTSQPVTQRPSLGVRTRRIRRYLSNLDAALRQDP